MQQVSVAAGKSQKQPAKLCLTTKDVELFEWIRTLRCLEQAQVNQLLGGKPDTIRRRLRKLADTGFLKKVQYGRLGGLYGVIWAPGRLLKHARGFTPDNWLSLKHQIGLNQIFIEMRARRMGSHFTWTDGAEVHINFGQTKIIPDAVIEARHGRVRILVEFDRNQKSLAKLEAQLRRYRDYFMSPYVGKRELLVLCFPDHTDYRVRKAKEMVEALYPGNVGFRRAYVGTVTEGLETISRFVMTEVAGNE